jgi:glutamate-1-semialdehyde 2,1-aminomutase
LILANLDSFIAYQTKLFEASHPKTLSLAQESAKVWRGGVAFHWMEDWATPVPLFATHAKDATLLDVDGHAYDDFCLGDTPSMFGHGLEPLQKALSLQAGQGMGFMLPTETSLEVGRLLAERFKLPLWQCATTASDANRAAIRWSRAMTGRPKILIIDGAYHGMVDDAFVVLKEGKPQMKPGLVGQVTDLTSTTVVVDFNDLEALSLALRQRNIACVLLEPVMTNCGIIMPEAGYHEALRKLCDETETLLIYDETHTISSGYGGYTGEYGLRPDILTIGKAIAGGVPAAVWGVTAEVAAHMEATQRQIEPGASGIGTTLSGNALAMAAMKVMLSEVMTHEAYGYMQKGTEKLVAGLTDTLSRHKLGWSVVHVGGRAELIFASAPKRATEMRIALDPKLLKAFHLFMINNRILMAPFHNMMLVSPKTKDAAIERFTAAFESFVIEYKSLNL